MTPIAVSPCTEDARSTLSASLALIGLLAILTVDVAVKNGVDVLVVLSLLDPGTARHRRGGGAHIAASR